jgi:hypothetical protein
MHCGSSHEEIGRFGSRVLAAELRSVGQFIPILCEFAKGLVARDLWSTASARAAKVVQRWCNGGAIKDCIRCEAVFCSQLTLNGVCPPERVNHRPDILIAVDVNHDYEAGL